MILDATAGNRTMWLWKECPQILHADMDRELQIKPDILIDNTQTPFLPQTFDSIFYDPPHMWGGAIHYFSFRNAEERKKVFPNATGVPTYYGWDKYKSKSALISHLNKASKEFYRILKDDGLLWIKWNEMSMPLRTVLIVFKEWQELMRLYVNDPTHTAGNAQTFWILLIKEKGEGKQLTLLDAGFSENSPQATLKVGELNT